MNDPLFEIGAPGIDTSRLVQEVRDAVARKTLQNVYADPKIVRAERFNLMNLKDDESFLAFYLESLRDAVFVDISDFEIFERRAHFSRLLILVKRLVWKALKFYTYRLWSQQNQVNGLLLSAMDSIQSRDRGKIRDLEERIQRLESRHT